MSSRHKKRRDNSQNPSSPATVAPMSRRKVWVFRGLIVALPLIFLLLLELALRIAGFGFNPDFFSELTESDGQTYLVDNPTFSLRFFPPRLARWPGSFHIAKQKPAGVHRIYIFGESAAMGDPQPAYGASRYLEVLLRERFKGQSFDVVNLGITAVDSHVILPIAREVAARGQGDLWIIYMGNNEMIGPFGAATVFGSRAPPLWAARLNLGIQRWRVGQLATLLIRNMTGKSSGKPVWDGLNMFEQNQIAPDDPRRETVYRNFEGNLRDTLKAGKTSGARVILCTMAVNLRDCPPFASISATNQIVGDNGQFRTLFNKALEFESQSNYSAAALSYEQACSLDPGFAEAHFRWGESLTALNETNTAMKQFQLACDDDGLPFRADSRINDIIRKAASDSNNRGLLLCDAASAINSASQSGIAGDDLFFEHVHFNFDGNYRLAMNWADLVAKAMTNDPAADATNGWTSQAECERRLGLTDFNRVAVLQTVMRRMEAPPLNAQFNNASRIMALKAADGVLQATLHQPDAFGRARDLIQTALTASPNDHYLYEALGNVAESDSDYSGAATAYRKSVELQPRDFYSRLRLGHVLGLLGQYPEATTVLKQASALRPSLPDGWYELATEQMLAGDDTTALANFDRACELQSADPKNQYARCRCLGKLFARQNQPDKAIGQFRQAIEILPGNWEGHFELGGELDGANQLDEATKEFGEAARLNPNYSRTHFNYAVMLAKQNRLEEAQAELETTLRLEPENKKAQDYLRQIQSLKRPQP
jgi:tetratricopeptide (TPR) repeat protein